LFSPSCLQELLEVVAEVKGRYLVTADHGNADDMAQVGVYWVTV